MPRVRAMQGNVGAIGLADRNSGQIRIITLWESPDALRRSESQADQLREETAKSGGQTIAKVQRYEVAVAQELSGVTA